ncbi:hypothetical protein KFL_007460020 [Klebsormidium nitens]|uniref:Fungal lipase-type domain-containing protein n=1 Tax=Klebsormidium nitens TaxID=105231 RepID=A0A1Y1IPT0_KLENI|nr:hypothetical protein KFL_007460020 [Klebsormidium nitens]|eukprot:GAQ91221.1 hypothetical protein KFL_007460020 [Klebsormidium nitens]
MVAAFAAPAAVCGRGGQRAQYAQHNRTLKWSADLRPYRQSLVQAMTIQDNEKSTLEETAIANSEISAPGLQISLESGPVAMLRVSSEVEHTELTSKPKPVVDAATAGSQTIALAAMQDADDNYSGGMPTGHRMRGGGEEARPVEDDEASLMAAHPPRVEERHEQERTGPPEIQESDRRGLAMENSFSEERAKDGGGAGGAADERPVVGRSLSERSGGSESEASGSHSKKEADGEKHKHSRNNSRSGRKRDLEKEAEELFRALPESVRKNVSHQEVENRLEKAKSEKRGSNSELGEAEKLDAQTGVMAKLVSDTGSESGKEGKTPERRPSHRTEQNPQSKLPEKVNEGLQYLSQSAKEVLEYAPRPLTPVVALFYRLCRDGSVESLTWNEAGDEEIQELLHYAKLCMGAYSLTAEDAVKDSEHVVKVESVAKLVSHNAEGKCPAHIIYLDKERRDIVLAVRGLDMTSVDDFNILEDNYRGQQAYMDGYVHAGFYKAAQWLVENEGPFIANLVKENPDFRLVMVGHSLGAGIAMTFTMMITDNPATVGGLRAEQIKCYGVAPPRCFSLDLSVKYSHVINSVVLQDDFLPRISTATVTAIFPLAGKTNCFCRFIVNYACWSLCKRCLRDTFVPQKALLQDPYRLYPPGRVYHVVHKFPCTCSCAKAPTKVKTDIPVKSRFERAVLTGSTFFDHNLTALIRVLKEELHVPEYRPVLQAPSEQKLQRASTMRREQGRALRQMADVQTMRKDKPPPKPKGPTAKAPAPKYPGLVRQGSRRLFPRELEMLGSALGQSPGHDLQAKTQGPFTQSILQRSMSTPLGGPDVGEKSPPEGSTEAAAAAAVAKADGKETGRRLDQRLSMTRSLDSQPTPRNHRSLSLVEEGDFEGELTPRASDTWHNQEGRDAAGQINEDVAGQRNEDVARGSDDLPGG